MTSAPPDPATPPSGEAAAATPSQSAPPTVASRWVAFRPLRSRDFALVWTAALISNVGTWMETVAVGDLVASRTGQAGWTALVAAAAFLPMGLASPIGGAIADRVDRRQFMLITTLLSTVCAGALTALSATGNASPGAIMVVVFVAGLVAGIGFPAYSAMMPDLVPKDALLAAMSLSQAQYNVGRVIGPALAGIAIALGSYTTAFALNAISFGAMLLALSMLRLPPQRPAPNEGSLWARIRAGASIAAREPGISSAVLWISIVGLTASPFIALIPAMARVRHDGGEGLTSAFVAAQGIGAVAGALTVPQLAERVGRRKMLMASFVALPVALILYGIAPSPVLAVAALVLVGVTYMGVFSGIATVVQQRAPAAARARVISVYFLALGTFYPIGAAIQGPLADSIGLSTMTVCGALALLVILGVTRIVRPDRLLSLTDLESYPGPLAAAPDDQVDRPAS